MPRKDLDSCSYKVGYRKHPGMVMWVFHRVSGVLIGLFLIFHLLGVSGVCEFIGDFVKMKGVIALISFLFVLHAANGVRIVLMEFASSAVRSKFMPHLLVTVGVVVVIGGAFAVKLFTAG